MFTVGLYVQALTDSSFATYYSERAAINLPKQVFPFRVARYSSEKHSSTEYDDFFLCFFLFCCCSSWCHEMMLAGESLKERKERKKLLSLNVSTHCELNRVGGIERGKVWARKKSIKLSVLDSKSTRTYPAAENVCVSVSERMEIHFNIYLIPFTYKFAYSHIDSVER